VRFGGTRAGARARCRASNARQKRSSGTTWTNLDGETAGLKALLADAELDEAMVKKIAERDFGRVSRGREPGPVR